ncbi:MAG: DUF5362 domain-containing protein [Clostridiales bacterium]|nr:DUF5362 domain-containing protein [Clostridiales bacterium]
MDEQYSNAQGLGYAVADDSRTAGVHNSLLLKGGKWGKFSGVLTIILGGLSCVGIITIPLGIFQIFAGKNLLAASERLEELAERKSAMAENEFYKEFCQFTKNFGIYYIIAIASTVLMFIIGIALSAFIFSMVLGNEVYNFYQY